jgi:hypothetical protein
LRGRLHGRNSVAAHIVPRVAAPLKTRVAKPPLHLYRLRERSGCEAPRVRVRAASTTAIGRASRAAGSHERHPCAPKAPRRCEGDVREHAKQQRLRSLALPLCGSTYPDQIRPDFA